MAAPTEALPSIPGLFVHRRKIEIPFSSAVAAAAQLTMLSGAILYPFQIIEATIIFDNDHVNNVLVIPMFSRNANTSTTDIPPDERIFGGTAQTGFIIGDSIIRVFRCNLQVLEVPAYLKVHVINNNAYAIDISAQILIKELAPLPVETEEP